MGGANRQTGRPAGPGQNQSRPAAGAPRPEDMAPAEAPAPGQPGMTTSQSAAPQRLGTGQSAPRPMPAMPTQNVWNSANANMAAGAVAL